MASQTHSPSNSCDGSITYMTLLAHERIAIWLRFWGCTAMSQILPSTTKCWIKISIKTSQTLSSKHDIYFTTSSSCCIYRNLQTVRSTPSVHIIMLQSHKHSCSTAALAEKEKLGYNFGMDWGVSRCTRDADALGCMWMVWLENVVVDKQWHQIRQSNRD